MNYFFQGDETVCRPAGANCDLKCPLCTGVPLRYTPAYDLVAPLGLSPACDLVAPLGLSPAYDLVAPLGLSTECVLVVEKSVRTGQGIGRRCSEAKPNGTPASCRLPPISSPIGATLSLTHGKNR